MKKKEENLSRENDGFYWGKSEVPKKRKDERKGKVKSQICNLDFL